MPVRPSPLPLAVITALAACGAPVAEISPPPSSPAAPDAVVAALGEARVVLRADEGVLVVAGGVRAVLEPSGVVRVAEDAFALPIVAVVRGEDGRFAFLDERGTVRTSRGFRGPLEPAAARGAGPALIHRRPGGVFLVSFGGPLAPISLPDRTTALELSSPQAGLAYADGGLLYRTRDGGASWQLVASGEGANAPFVHALSDVRVWIAGALMSLSPEGELVALATDPSTEDRLRPLDARERQALLSARAGPGARGRVVAPDLAWPPRVDPAPGELRCRAAGSPRPSAAPAMLITRASAHRHRVRAGRWQLEIETRACAPGAHPALALERSTAEHALLSCVTGDGAECPCGAPGYWARPRGVVPLPRPIAQVREVLRLEDGGLAIRAAPSADDERILHLDAAGALLAERAFRWTTNPPRALHVRHGRPHLAVASGDRRAVDLFDLDGGAPVARIAARVRAPRRTCAPTDRGVRLSTDRALLELVWTDRPPHLPPALALDLLVDETDTCLAGAAVLTDGGRADLSPRGPRALDGVLDEDDRRVELACQLVPSALADRGE